MDADWGSSSDEETVAERAERDAMKLQETMALLKQFEQTREPEKSYGATGNNFESLWTHVFARAVCNALLMPTFESVCQGMRAASLGKSVPRRRAGPYGRSLLLPAVRAPHAPLPAQRSFPKDGMQFAAYIYVDARVCMHVHVLCEYPSYMWTYTQTEASIYTHTHNTEAAEQSRRGEDGGKGNIHILNKDVTLVIKSINKTLLELPEQSL
jgi:hypothetical protein